MILSVSDVVIFTCLILKQSLMIRTAILENEVRNKHRQKGKNGVSTPGHTDPSKFCAPPNNSILALKAAFGIPLRNTEYSLRKALLFRRSFLFFFL